MMQQTSPRRYIITKLNGRFVVTDSRSSELIVVNDKGRPADVRNADETRFFAMDLTDAEQLAEQLN